LNDEGQTSDVVGWPQIRLALSAKQEAIDKFKDAMGLEGEFIKCSDLCRSLVSIAEQNGKTLPNASDWGCYEVGASTFCDVDVDPGRLGAFMGKSNTTVAYDDKHTTDSEINSGNTSLLSYRKITTESVNPPQQTSVLQQDSPNDEEHNDAYGDTLKQGIPYSTVSFVVRMLNEFRIYCSTGKLHISSGKSSLIEADTERNQGAIGILAVQAKGWVSAALNEMGAYKTRAKRAEWFNTAASTRTRILNTLNFVMRHIDNFNYIYPASSCSRDCGGVSGGGTLAYVCQNVGPDGYSESVGPVCRGSGACGDCCALDSRGHRNIYLCQRWYEWPQESVRIGTIVHEAVHHCGPSDQSYDERVMKGLSIQKQLDNAASYQNFVRDVAASAGGPGTPRRRRSGGSGTPSRRRSGTSNRPACPNTPVTRKCLSYCSCPSSETKKQYSCGNGCICYGCVSSGSVPTCPNTPATGTCSAVCSCPTSAQKKAYNCGSGCTCYGCVHR